MHLFEVILSGVVSGGLYALIAIGFNLQYGVARIFNLAYGEFLMAAAFAAFWMFTLVSIDPILGMALSVPVTFAANWLVYRVLMLPLVRRARTRDDLEGDTILATFGLLFVLKGAAQLAFTPDNRFYNYLNTPVHIVGVTFAANRVLAFGVACAFGLAIWLDPQAHAVRRRDARARHRADRRPPGRRRRHRDVGDRVRVGRRAGGGGRHAGQHLPHLQPGDRRRIHHEGAGRGDDGRRRQHARQPGGGRAARASRNRSARTSSIPA